MITVGLSLVHRPCLVVGGGSVAQRRVVKLLEEQARITLVSPHVLPDLAALAEEGRIAWIQDTYESAYMQGMEFVIIATDQELVNDQVMADARKVNAFINRADRQADSTLAFMSHIGLGNLEISLMTNQVSPRVSRLIRQDMEARYAPFLEWLPWIREWREEVKTILPTPKEREAFWRTYLSEEAFQQIVEGQGDSVKENIVHAISCIRSKS